MAAKLFDLCGRDRELRFSPYCWRAKMALAHKGVAFETVATTFSAIAAVAPGRAETVPILATEGQTVHDSFAIALHLETTYPDRPALFGDEGVVAAARFLESWAFGTLHPIIARMILKDIHEALDPADQSYFRRSREARFGATLEALAGNAAADAAALAKALEPARRTLARHEWLGGGQPLFTDYILFGTLMWLFVIHGSLPLEAEDAVASWFERCRDLHGGLARQARIAA